MTSTPKPEPGRCHHRAPHRRAASTSHGRHRAPLRTPAAGGFRRPRPTTLWPFADAEALPGTAKLPGWLGRTIVTLVTTYTRPGDRVLLLAPPQPLCALGRALGGARAADAYGGLAEAVWTVARLGRGSATATAAPAPDYPGAGADSRRGAGAESGSRPRLSRLNLHSATDRSAEAARGRCQAEDRPYGRFDLIITALDPHTTEWLPHTDWDALLTPHGLTAVVTHSDSQGGRLRDPIPTMVNTLGSRGLRYLDHIGVLTGPVPDPATGPACAATPSPDRLPRAVQIAAPPLRPVHHDLVLFARLSSAPPLAGLRRKETLDV